MHNNIMAAGSRDRPPMLATGRYAQWRSRFLRYIDTRPNGDALRKCILTGPYTPTMVTTPAVPATEDSPEIPAKTSVETVLNMTPENKAHYESEKEAIHLILTGIGDEIYSTVDACQTTQEMWEAIERNLHGGKCAHPGLTFQDICKNWGKLDQFSAYYNGSCTSKDNEDLSWSTSFKTRRTQKTSLALEALWKTLFMLYLYKIVNIVLAKVGKVAYRLELPQELSRVHHTFHVSNLKKCYADEPLAMPLEGIHIDDKL
ncbi:hypothetical protein Tco_1329228 [Tanacetum coccineum]